MIHSVLEKRWVAHRNHRLTDIVTWNDVNLFNVNS